MQTEHVFSVQYTAFDEHVRIVCYAVDAFQNFFIQQSVLQAYQKITGFSCCGR